MTTDTMPEISRSPLAFVKDRAFIRGAVGFFAAALITAFVLSYGWLVYTVYQDHTRTNDVVVYLNQQAIKATQPTGGK